MTKIKKLILPVIFLLLTALLTFTLFGCNKSSKPDNENNSVNETKNEEVTPYGIYTNLSFSIDGGNGKVWASAKNEFTLFPSTVIVNIELYNSDTYQESFENMKLVATNNTADLDQGETLTVTALTDGKPSYWKVRAKYKIDGKAWQEYISDTALINAGSDPSAQLKGEQSATDNREYYVSDFLQSDAEIIQINIPYKHTICYDPDPRYMLGFTTGEAYVWLENEEEINAVKDLFGEIKLEPYNIDIKSYEGKQQYYALSTRPYLMYIKLSDGNTATICINDRYQDDFGVNLFVHYYNSTNSDNKFSKYFMASISDEAKEAIVDSAKKKYEREHNINSSATEWTNLCELLQDNVKTAKISMLVKRAYYDMDNICHPDEKIHFNVDENNLRSLLDIINKTDIAAFEMNAEGQGITQSDAYKAGCTYCYYSLSIKFDNNSCADIYISNMYTNTVSINLYVCYKDGETCKYFTGLLDNETQENLVESTKNIYESKKGE